MTELSDMFIASVGEQANAALRPRSTSGADSYPGTLGLCAHCFGLVREGESGVIVHLSGIVGCADSIRAFVNEGAAW